MTTAVHFDPSKFNHQHAVCGGFNYHYVDQGPKDGLPVVLVHGFPDLWYGWRHQIQFLVSLGRYRVIVPDMLGYGESDKPKATDREQRQHHPAYSPKSLASHIVALLDHLKIERPAVLIGHDWGTGIVSRVGWHFPERALATIATGNPFRPVTERLITPEDFASENPAFQYFSYFASPEAIVDFDEGVEDIVGELFSEENGNSDEDRAYYIQSHRKGGFHGPLSYYKTFAASHQEDLYLVGKRYPIPTLLIVVKSDHIVTPEYCYQVPADYFDVLEIQELDEGGHWCLTANPEGVNKLLGEYLCRISLQAGIIGRLDTCRRLAIGARARL